MSTIVSRVEYGGPGSRRPGAVWQRVSTAVWETLKRIQNDEDESGGEEIFVTPPQSPSQFRQEDSKCDCNNNLKSIRKAARMLEMHDRVLDQILWEPKVLPCPSELKPVRRCRWRQTTVCYAPGANANLSGFESTEDLPDCNTSGSAYHALLVEKRKASGRERTRRCRARKAELQSEQELVSASISNVDPKFSVAGHKQAHRTSATLARDISLYALKKMQNHETEVHHLTIMKILGQPILQQMVPAFLRDPVAVKLRHDVLGTLRDGMQSHLVGLRKAKTLQAKNIVTTFAVAPGIGSGRGVAGILGVDRRNIKKAVARRVLLDTKQDAFWLHDLKRVRSDALADSTRKIISQWWEEQTTVSPNRKDIIRKWISPKLYIEHATHYLQVSQLEFFTEFKKKYPDLACGLRTFEGLKSWWVRRLTQWNTCCCRYHQDFSDLRDGLNAMRRDLLGVHKDCTCQCIVCATIRDCETIGTGCDAHNEVYDRLTHLWSSVLCQKDEFQVWYKRECLLGDCEKCGVQNLRICPGEVSSRTLVKWKRTGYEQMGVGEDGKAKKAIQIVYCETPPSELLDYLKPKLSEFIRHNFFAAWQDLQFKELFSSVPDGTLISCMDFSENYSMKIQNEIQSMHWRSQQVSILVHITYRLNPDWSFSGDEPYLLKEVHYYVSDDKCHDSLYVQHAFMLHWGYLKREGVQPANHVVWTDGCSGQFKSARAWYFVSRFPSLTVSDDLPEGCQMSWNYFASGHGKGEVDGAGALLKRELYKEQLKPNGRQLQCAAHVVRFLQEESNKFHAGRIGERQKITKFFWEIKERDILRVDKLEAETIPGSRGMHQCRSISCKDPTLIQFRQLTCYCVSCSDPNSDLPCYQKAHVPNWTLRRICPKSTTSLRILFDPDWDDTEADVGSDIVGKTVRVGFNIAVRADSENGETFWVMLVTKGEHLNASAFTDEFGNEFVPGESLIQGYWYEQYAPDSRTYLLRDDRPFAYVHSHAILLSGFSMPPTAHSVKGNFASYELRVHILDSIIASSLDAEA